MSTKLKFILIFIAIFAILAIVNLLYLSNNIDNYESFSNIENENQDSPFETTESLGEYKISVIDALSESPLMATLTLRQKEEIINTVSCDETGTYLFNTPLGNYDLTASIEGYVSAGRNDLTHTIKVSETPAQTEIKLWPEAKLKGHIVGDGRSVAAKLDFIYIKDTSDATNYTFDFMTTPDDGEFLLDQAYAGKMKLMISAENYPVQTLSNIRLTPGETVDLGDIPLKPGTSVYGSVTSTVDQTGIDRAEVQLIKNDEIIAKTKTKDGGFYRLPPVESLSQTQIVITAQGYHEHRKALSSTQRINLEYNTEMSAMTGLYLNIYNNTGRAPKYAHLVITDTATDNILLEKNYENGAYMLEQFTDGPYLLTLTSPDGQTEATARAVGGDTVNLTLKPFARINVQCIINKTGKPTKGTYRYHYTSPDGNTTSTSEWIAFSDESFFIDNLKPGTYTIDARSNDLKYDSAHISHTYPITLAMGDTVFTKIALTSGGTIRGKIHLPPAFAGKGGGIMALKKYNYDSDEETGVTSSLSGYSGSFDRNGEFVMDTLPSGKFDLMIFTLDKQVSYFTDIEVGDNDDINMYFDMTYMRHTANDGTSLFLPTMPQEPENPTPEEIEARNQEILEMITNWQNALKEQAQYQNEMFESAKTAPQDMLDDE